MIILYAEVYRAINKRKQWDFSKSNPEENLYSGRFKQLLSHLLFKILSARRKSQKVALLLRNRFVISHHLTLWWSIWCWSSSLQCLNILRFVDRFISYGPSKYHISRYIEACFKFSEPKLMPKRSQYSHYNKPKVEISFNISSFESEASGYPVWNIKKFIYKTILCRCLFFIDFSTFYASLKIFIQPVEDSNDGQTGSPAAKKNMWSKMSNQDGYVWSWEITVKHQRNILIWR